MTKHVGLIDQEIVLNGQRCFFNFLVVKKEQQALLDLQASERLGLVSRSIDTVTRNSPWQLVHEFSGLFEGTVCVGREYRMALREDATPVVHAARCVPLAL